MDRIEIREKLKERLTAKRFEHSLGVEYTAAAMAMCHRVNVEQAAIAGLLHDCAKSIDCPFRIMSVKIRNYFMQSLERQSPKINIRLKTVKSCLRSPGIQPDARICRIWTRLFILQIISNRIAKCCRSFRRSGGRHLPI